MVDYCGNCAYFDLKQKEYWGDRYYCTETCKYKEKSDTACKRYIKKPDGGYQRAGCFITTVVCYKLGYRDNCEFLNYLRYFREKHLKNSPTGIMILQEYDQIGPIIIKELEKCPVADSILLMNNFIVPCTMALKQGHNEEATKIYINMVEGLKERFSYALQDIRIDYKEQFIPEDLGKGRGRKKPANA